MDFIELKKLILSSLIIELICTRIRFGVHYRLDERCNALALAAHIFRFLFIAMAGFQFVAVGSTYLIAILFFIELNILFDPVYSFKSNQIDHCGALQWCMVQT